MPPSGDLGCALTDWRDLIPSDAGIINAIAGVKSGFLLLLRPYISFGRAGSEGIGCYNRKRIVMRPSGRNRISSGPKSVTSSLPYMTLPLTKGYPAPLRGNPYIQIKKIGNDFNEHLTMECNNIVSEWRTISEAM